MDIKFYQNVSDKRVINKTLNIEYSLTGCQLEEPTSAIDPVFIIDMTEGLYQYNYCYVPYFSRYYYITDMTAIDGQRMAIKCHVDPLMSFKDAILNCYVNSRCNENNYDMYLPDDRPIESRYIRYSKKFNKSFEDFTPSYILITVGNGDLNIV